MLSATQTSIKEINCSAFDHDLIINIAEEFKEFDFYNNEIINESSFVHKVIENFSKPMQEILGAMGKGCGPDVLIINNIPVDIPLSTYDDLAEKVRNKSRQSEVALSSFCVLMGGLLQREESSHQSGYIQQIHPLKSYKQESSGRGAEPLPFHVENAFIEDSPSFLALVCLTGQKNIRTELVGVKDILGFLDKATINTLRKPIYTIRSADGFRPKQLENTAVIHDLDSWVLARIYEEDRILTSDPEGQMAIVNLKNAIDQAKSFYVTFVELEPGTAVIFSNGMGRETPAGVLHGRSGRISLTPNNQSNMPMQRWLQRACIKVPYTLDQR
ncbi:hypothetical protein [Acinetobacter venetianus]|uniref:hypothetical protein n=1 Tax=Acinetobacter venetianus TaxID=52133 RepID=UPI0028987A42|nr:hypothetical protein [Acinetobacter venetianus]